jgi:hypothetical protein
LANFNGCPYFFAYFFWVLWLEMVQHFGRRYRRAAGAVDKLQAFGQKMGRYWLQGVTASRQFYQSPEPEPG